MKHFILTLLTMTAIGITLPVIAIAQDSAPEEPANCPAPTPEAKARAAKVKEMMAELERQEEQAADKYASATNDLSSAQKAYLEHMDKILSRSLSPYKDLFIIKGFIKLCGFDIETNEWAREAYNHIKKEKDAEKEQLWQKYKALMNAVDFLDMGLLFQHTSLKTKYHYNEIAREVTEVLREGTLMKCDDVTALLKKYNPDGEMSIPLNMSLPPQENKEEAQP